jgi:hypothetical protein
MRDDGLLRLLANTKPHLLEDQNSGILCWVTNVRRCRTAQIFKKMRIWQLTTSAKECLDSIFIHWKVEPYCGDGTGWVRSCTSCSIRIWIKFCHILQIWKSLSIPKYHTCFPRQKVLSNAMKIPRKTWFSEHGIVNVSRRSRNLCKMTRFAEADCTGRVQNFWNIYRLLENKLCVYILVYSILS